MSLEQKIKQRYQEITRSSPQLGLADFAQFRDFVLALFGNYDIKPKLEEWEESVGEAFQKMHEEINRKLKFHGIFKSDTSIIIDKKQDKFVIIEKAKLQKCLGTYEIAQKCDDPVNEAIKILKEILNGTWRKW